MCLRMMSSERPLSFRHVPAVGLPDYGKCNSAPPPRDGVRGCHGYQNRKWCDCCLSKNGAEEWDFCTEHKPAGRKPHFYHSFNFDFLSGEVPLTPLSPARCLPALVPPFSELPNRTFPASDTGKKPPTVPMP